MANDRLLIAGGGLLVFTAMMGGFMVFGYGNKTRVVSLASSPGDLALMSSTGGGLQLDGVHAKIDARLADFERTFGSSVEVLGEKLDRLAVANAQSMQASAVAAAVGGAATANGDGAASTVVLEKAADAAGSNAGTITGASQGPVKQVPDFSSIGAPKKRAFASYVDPAKVTKTMDKASAHICSGRDFVGDQQKGSIPNSDQHAHCYYRNLCIAPGKGARPKHFATRGHFDWYYLYDGVPPSQREKTDSVNFTLGVGPHEVDNKLMIAPKIVSLGDFNKEFPVVRVEPTLTHIFYEFNAENFGHAVTDVLMPMYSALAGFDKLDYDVQLVKFQMSHDLGFSCDYQRNPGWGNANWIPDRIVNPRADKLCQKFYDMLFPGMSSRPLVMLERLINGAQDNATTTPVCFDKLLVGTPMLSDDCMEGSHGRNLNLYSQCMTGRMEQMWNFRTYLKANLGVADVRPKEHHVVIWQRNDGKRALRGLDVLAHRLRAKFKVKVTVIDWAKISIQKQLALIGSATIHITGPGGGSFIAMFLPRGATSIRLYASDFGMEFHFFNYLGYMHADYRHARGGVLDSANVEDLVAIGMHRYDTFNDAPLPPGPEVPTAPLAPDRSYPRGPDEVVDRLGRPMDFHSGPP